MEIKASAHRARLIVAITPGIITPSHPSATLGRHRIAQSRKTIQAVVAVSANKRLQAGRVPVQYIAVVIARAITHPKVEDIAGRRAVQTRLQRNHHQEGQPRAETGFLENLPIWEVHHET